MTIKWIDGFDVYSSAAHMSARGYASVPSSPTFDTGRFAGQRVKWIGGTLAWPASGGSAIANLSVGFAFQTGNISTQGKILEFVNGSTIIACLRCTSLGALQAERGDGTAVLGTTSAGAVATDVWTYIEVELTRNASTGVFKVYQDGVQVLNLTAQNTGASDIDTLVLRSTTPEIRIDDLYSTDAATKLGTCRVDTIRPNADTAQKDWTASTGSDNYAMVDETTISTGDYVTTGTVGDKDYYACADLAFTPNTVHAVNALAYAKKDDSNTRTYRTNIKVSSSEANGATRTLSSTYSLYADIFETDPATSASWDASGVNSVQIGPEVVS